MLKKKAAKKVRAKKAAKKKPVSRKRDVAPRELPLKQLTFIAEYLANGFNATAAAKTAGYSKRTAESQGSRLLKNVKVAAAIAEATSERLANLEITADYVLKTIQSTIERCRQTEQVFFRGWPVEGKYQFDAQNVLKGAELLGKHLKLFTERVELEGELTLVVDI